MNSPVPAGVSSLPPWLPAWLTQFLPPWLPWWVPAVLLLPVCLYVLLALLMPFGTFGVKSRLEDIELQIEQLRAEVREMMQQLRPAEEPRLLDPTRLGEARSGETWAAGPRLAERGPERRAPSRYAPRLEPRLEARLESRTGPPLGPPQMPL